VPVGGVDRGSVNPNQQLVVLDHRLVDVREFQDIW
jgi:hypothetical protein